MSFPNAYGSFADDGLEYIITRPDTPMPWVNVISNGDYGLVVSQAGSGYSWRTHASLNRITRWEQDLIRDEWGKYLWLRDAETESWWSLTRQPSGEQLSDYRVRHGLGYSVIEARHDGIASSVCYTVPHGDPCELWRVTLANTGDRPRRVQLFSYFEWLLGAAPDWHREFHRIFIETRFDRDQNAILATKVLWDLPGESGPHWNRSWPYVAFHSASLPPAGFDTDKRAFLGRHGDVHAPHAVKTGSSAGTTGRWGDAIGSLQLEAEIAPGETAEIVFVLGAADNEQQAATLIEKYRSPAAFGSALDQVQQFWHDIVDALVIDTPDPAFDLLGNTWLKYQAISGRLWARTAYYQTGGAYGFRDQLQDSLIWLLLGQPERTLDQIRLHAAHQYADGVVLHWWHPLAESGLRSGYSDDLLWLPFAVLRYVEETGDLAPLDEEIPFYDGGAAPLREHCLRAFEHALGRRSPRGLPLIGDADWNDGLNAVGAAGRGESVWMGHFLHLLLRGWAALPLLENTIRDRLGVEADAIKAAVNAHGWDGSWYWRATTDNGDLLGSHANAEGRIFLNAQTWAILADTAPPDRAQNAIDAARELLFKEWGPLLLAPAYSVPDPHVGYLTRYAPGTRENGGLYTHAGCWAILAERRMGNADSAYRLWRSFCPVLRGDEPDRYMAEPYVTPGNVDGPQSEFPGRGGWTWYTGSAQWYLRAMVEAILGVTATWDGLRIEPQLPADWDRYFVKRRFRGAEYEITVRRAQGHEQPAWTINGEQTHGPLLPVAPVGSRFVVEIVI
jgi:cellobiose phosphorylase